MGRLGHARMDYFVGNRRFLRRSAQGLSAWSDWVGWWGGAPKRALAGLWYAPRTTHVAILGGLGAAAYNTWEKE
jgi:hypothetical protein